MTPPGSALSRVDRSTASRRRNVVGVAAVVALASLAGCAHSRQSSPVGGDEPRVREITVTTVPLLVRESQALYPFLKSDFAKGGVLEGKEVYAFEPSTIVVVQGDTIHFTLVNPEDDVHTFVLPDLAVTLPGQQVTRASFVARRCGIFPLVCNLPNHLPMMSGQLVVLAPSAVNGVAPGAR